MAKEFNPEIAEEIKGYIDESKEQLIARTVLGSKTIGLASLMGGVKGKTALNYLDTDVVLQDASECGWNPTSSNEISRRYVEPAYLGVQMEFCDKNFLNTYAAYKLRIAAGQKTLPYAEDFIASVIDNVNESLEKMVWQGDSSNTGATEFDGYLKLAKDASATTLTYAEGSSVWSAIKEVYMAVPERAIKEDLAIFVGADTFRAFVQELVAANLYHYNPNDEPLEYRLPGTDVRVIAVHGLDGTGTIFASRLSNLIFATDMLGDKEVVDFWYSKDDQIFKLNIEFMAGVQIVFPDEVVISNEK